MSDRPPVACDRCGRSVPYDASVYVSASWSDTRALAGQRHLLLCCPCSVPVVDALKAVLEPRRIARPTKRLPTTAELAGSDPDFTGGMGAEEFVRRGRGTWP